MKKILSLIMVFFLLCANTIFATEGDGAEETAPLSNETSVGLYYYDSWNKNYSSELYLSLGSRTKADFYFYDGNDYNEVKVGSLIPSEKIKLTLKEDHSQKNNPLKIFVASSKIGDGTISSNYVFKLSHSVDQREYLEWKVGLLNKLEIKNTIQ